VRDCRAASVAAPLVAVLIAVLISEVGRFRSDLR